MKYLHIFACFISLSFECIGANPLSRTIPTNLSGLPSCYIIESNSSDVIQKHIAYLEKAHEELATLKDKDENNTSHNYASMKKCIACVISLFDTSTSPHESLKDILKTNTGYTSSIAVEERLKDDVVANAINTIEKYRGSQGNNKDFLGSFQTHCLCLALRNGFLEKETIETFVKKKIADIQKQINPELNFEFAENIGKTVAGACADAIQYFCLDKLIMDLTHSVYRNNLKVKKFASNDHKKEAIAMNLLLSNDLFRQKVIEKKYKEATEEKTEIVEEQNDLINCACSAVLKSLPYSPYAYNEDSIQFPEKSIFGNSKDTIGTIFKYVLGENIGVTEKDFSTQKEQLPTPFYNEISKELKNDIVIYLCKNANSEGTGSRKSNAIGQFTPNNVAMIKNTKYKTLSFIGFSNDFNNVDLFEKFGDEISYETKQKEYTLSTETANIWLKNGAIVKDADKMTKHPDNYLFILYKVK